MKSLMLLLQAVLDDLSTWCCTSTTRDLKTITSRVEHEGLSFLTITLASFGKDFQKSLDQGFVGHDQFPGFNRAGGLPQFLGGFLDRVFDRKTGWLVNEPDINSIWAINQICLMFAKINLPCSQSRNKKAMLSYVDCENAVKAGDRSRSDTLLMEYASASGRLWAECFSDIDQKIYTGEIIPTHGPGSTADSLLGNEKWKQRSWTRRLDSEFPVGDYVIPNYRYHEELERFNIIEPGEELPSKVILVPKTLKTPRVIAMEPAVMMFMQQALLATITESVERNDSARQILGWKDQMPNRHLASQGSLSGNLATLDLSEASDRVSNQLVRAMLANFGSFARAVDATRSRRASVLVPGESSKTIRLGKFASMGSALTFPLESFVFATIVFMAISKESNLPLTPDLVKSFRGRVRVYGDDIVIPVEFVRATISLLEAFGLKVNVNKSFWTGKFRESCGGEYYGGEDVSIVRLRSMFPTCRTDATEIISTVSFRNQCYHAGLWKTVRFVDDYIRGMKLPFPVVESTSPGLGRHSYLGYQSEKHCPDLHRPLVKAMVVKSTLPASELEGVDALMKCLTRSERSFFKGSSGEPSEMPSADVGHLLRSGRPQRVDIKLRWVTPF